MLIKKLKSLNKSNFATIFKGNFISKFVLVIGGLFLAKFYGTNDYGEFSIFISLGIIMSILLSFGVEHLIILDTKEKDITNHFNSGNILGLGFLTLVIIITLTSPFNFTNMKTLQLGLISGFFILFVSNTKLLLSKVEKFKFISLLTICDAMVSFLMQCIFLYFEIKDGLIWGSFVGFSSAFLLAIILSKKWIQKPNFNFFFQRVKEHKNLVKIVYPSSLLNALGNQIMPILMQVYFSTKLLGEYAMATKILSTPLLLVSSSMAVIYYPKAVDIHLKKRMRNLFLYTKKTSSYNFSTVFILFILINTIGIYLLQFLFNKDWEHLRMFTLILSFGFLARSLINPIADVLTVLNKNHITLYFNCYLVLSNVLAIIIGKENGFTLLVLSFSFFLSLGYGLLYWYIMHYLNKNE